MNMKKTIVVLTLFATLAFFTQTVYAATGDSAELDPTNPAPEDIITFTITPLDPDNVTEVYIELQECNGNTGVCYGFLNESAVPNGEVYTLEIDLQHQDATYITYTIVTNGENGWNENEAVELQLSKENNGNNGSSGTSDGDEDFDPLMYFVGAILAVVIIGAILIIYVLRH